MKIEGPNKTQSAGSAKKSGSVSSGDATFGNMLAGEAEEAPAPAASQQIARIDSLLSIQGAESPTERAARRRMKKRGDDILDELEKIRIALLTGNLTVGHIIDIADVVASHREKVMDPEMTAILDEIDLRAQIEMAKMRVALDRRASA